jgi:hypothetical protein
MEAGGLAVFLLVAGSLTTLFEHPASPVRRPSAPSCSVTRWWAWAWVS